MKIVFGMPPANDEIRYIDANEGQFATVSANATVDYKIDRHDPSIRLNIDGDWFWGNDLDELIAFLQAAREEIKK